MEDDKGRILLGLYVSVSESYRDSCFGMNSSGYDEKVREYLREADGLGLTCGDFYDFCEEKARGKKDESIERIKENGLEVKLRKENGKLFLISFGMKEELDFGLSLEEFYVKSMAEKISATEWKEPGRKFMDNESLSLDRYSGILNYFSNS